MIDKVRETSPLIHCITNYVTAGHVADMLLAAGASPVMADGINEVEDITAISQGLVINIGTLNGRSVESMIKAGRKAASLKHPVIFDPVGAGASSFRTDAAKRILKQVPCSVIRGNATEIKTIAGIAGVGWVSEDNKASPARGVDLSKEDAVTEKNVSQICESAKALSRITNSIIAVTGAVDVAADDKRAYIIRNGHPMMAGITGTGCMLDGLIAAFLSAVREEGAKAAAEAIAAEGLCGELAYRKITEQEEGSGSFRVYLLDYMSRLNHQQLNGGKNIEIR